MQLSLLGLRALDESRLRREVLIPLFRAMGYREVTELHGSSELGKDIVMWQEDLLRGRVNFAVVVKAVRISSGGVSTDVCRQVREAIGSTYTDPVSLEERKAHRILVVTSKGVTTPARKSIQSELKELVSEGRLDLLDGEHLIEQIRRHIPRAFLWAPLQEIGRALKEGESGFDYIFQTSSDGVPTLFLRPDMRHTTGSSRVASSFQLKPPTDDPTSIAHSEMSKFLDTGQALELGEEVLGEIRLPEIISSLMGDAKIKSLRLSPARLPERMLVALQFTGNGAVIHEFSYFDFTHSRGGKKEGALENLDQQIAIRAKLVLDKKSRRIELNLEFQWKEANVFQLLNWALIQRAYTRSAHIRLFDFNTGAPLGVIETSHGTSETQPPDDRSIEVLRRLAAIQAATGVIIPAPLEGAISAEEMRPIYRASEAVTRGYLKEVSGRISFTPEERGLDEYHENIGKVIQVQLPEEHAIETILGLEIDMGPKVLFVQGILHYDESQVENRFFIDATPELPFIEVFQRWFRPVAPSEDGPLEQS